MLFIAASNLFLSVAIAHVVQKRENVDLPLPEKYYSEVETGGIFKRCKYLFNSLDDLIYSSNLIIIPIQDTTCPTDGSGVSNSAKVSGSSLILTATGCPPYDWTSQSTPNVATYLSLNVTLNWPPIMSSTKTYIGIKDANGNTNSNPFMGVLGIAVGN